MYKFNDDTRVKIPATIQFLRIGYKYQSLKDEDIDIDFNTKIFINRLKPALEKINGRDFSYDELKNITNEIYSVIKNNDLGKEFYNWLINPLDKVKLIDLEHYDNNDFAVVDEFSYGVVEGTEEGSFRPDINILINGIPLAFLEVKKPNNEGGIQKEFDRMINKRLQNEDYKKFFNMIQIVSFSNNMEYEDSDDVEDIKAGSFYTTPNGTKTSFSFFREDEDTFLDNYNYKTIDEKTIKDVTKDCLVQDLYNYWFNQFNFPNENGIAYKFNHGKLVWNRQLKKDIPKRWKVLFLKDCIKHINTGLNPRDNFKLGDGSIKYVTVKNLTTNGTIDFSSCDVINEKARKIVHKRSDVSKGDILFASIAPLGRCVIVKENPVDWDINESVFCIRPDLKKVSTEYLYSYFMSDYFIKKAEHSSTGSIFSGIRVNILEEMPILIPNKKVMTQFTNQVSNLFEMKSKKENENEKLISLRNFLLPLLMNGQITFKD